MRIIKHIFLLFLGFHLWAGVQYRILVVKSDYPDLQDFQTHIIQFLDASTFKYDALEPGEEIEKSLLLSGDNLNYSTIILFRRGPEMYPSERETLEKAAQEGISLISFVDVIGESPFYRELFSIEEIGDWEEAGNIRIKSGLGFLTHEIEGEKLKPSLIRELRLKKTCRAIATSGTNIPVVAACPYSKAINYLFNLSKDSLSWWYSEWGKSDKDPRLVLLRRAIIENSGLGFVYYDLSHTVILRIDDFLQNRHTWEDPVYPEYPLVTHRMDEEYLKEIGDIFQKHNAHVTFLVVPGFVDPGPEKGILLVNGHSPALRQCGTIYDVKDVVFKVTSGWNAGDTYNYPPEYRGIVELIHRGLVDVQEHGFTHINWKKDEWCASPTRATNPFPWEREFVDLVDHEPVPEYVQEDILYQGFIRLKNWFSHEPIALIPPGHAHDETTLEVAHRFGIKLFSVDWLGIWKDWGYDKNQQIKSLFINYIHWSPPPSLLWHIAASPHLVYFHDWDLILGGPDWLEEFLTQWEETLNVKHFISLSEFAGYYFSQIEASREGNRFTVTVDISNTGGPHDLPQDRFFSSHSLTLKIHLPDNLWRTHFYFRGFAEASSNSPSVKRVYLKDGEVVVELKPFGKASRKTAEITFVEGRR